MPQQAFAVMWGFGVLLLLLLFFHSKGERSWVYIGRTDAEAETPVLWPPHAKSWLIGRPWCWEGLGAGEGDDRGWDGWMASLTQWTWVWVNCRSWWWTGSPGVLRFMGSQRDTTERLNWIHFFNNVLKHIFLRVFSFISKSECLIKQYGTHMLNVFKPVCYRYCIVWHWHSLL